MVMIKRLVIIFSFIIVFSSCAKNDQEIYVPTKLSDPYKLYSEGLDAFKKNDFFFANKKFSEAELSFEKPGWFLLHAQEHEAARKNVVLIDQSTFGKLIVKGRDSEKFLQRVCANDISSAHDKVVYTPMLNAHGGYESDLTIMGLDDDRFLLITGTGQPVRDYNWICNKIKPEELVSVSDITGDYAVISVAGPNSRKYIGARLSLD